MARCVHQTWCQGVHKPSRFQCKTLLQGYHLSTCAHPAAAVVMQGDSVVSCIDYSTSQVSWLMRGVALCQGPGLDAVWIGT